jgi:hypothetical protein
MKARKPIPEPANGAGSFVLAQYNIVWMLAPLDDPRMADFVASIERLNELAERSPGFVWRHHDENGNSTGTRVRGDDRILINFSLWESVESLFAYAFRSSHVEAYRRRRDWFSHEDEPYAVLWWVPAGHIPTVEEAEERLARLKRDGPGPEAFTFKHRFPPPSPAVR